MPPSTAASLGNQAGTISARNLSLNTGTGAIDNTKGTVSAAGTATVDAGSLINQGRHAGRGGDVQANVGRLDNTGGALGSQSASLNVTSTGAIDNAGGKLVAAQDATLRAASLGNQGGTISARNLSLNTGSRSARQHRRHGVRRRYGCLDGRSGQPWRHAGRRG